MRYLYYFNPKLVDINWVLNKQELHYAIADYYSYFNIPTREELDSIIDKYYNILKDKPNTDTVETGDTTNPLNNKNILPQFPSWFGTIYTLEGEYLETIEGNSEEEIIAKYKLYKHKYPTKSDKMVTYCAQNIIQPTVHVTLDKCKV